VKSIFPIMFAFTLSRCVSYTRAQHRHRHMFVRLLRVRIGLWYCQRRVAQEIDFLTSNFIRPRDETPTRVIQRRLSWVNTAKTRKFSTNKSYVMETIKDKRIDGILIGSRIRDFDWYNNFDDLDWLWRTRNASPYPT